MKGGLPSATGGWPSWSPPNHSTPEALFQGPGLQQLRTLFLGRHVLVLCGLIGGGGGGW